MFLKWIKRLGIVVIAAFLAIGAYIMIKPQPVGVDIAVISRGEIETTVDEDGKTRIKNVYRISAPISGKLERLSVQAGDGVEKGERIARLRPVDPPIRDIRTRRQLSAATKSAHAGVKLGQAEIARARSALDFSKTELARAQKLALTHTISIRALQQAELDVAVKNAQLAQAQASLEFKRRELESAQARELLPTQISRPELEDQCCVAIVAPIAGTVLKLFTESEQVVGAGASLLEVGNLKDIEVVVDLLSVDAVGIAPGTLARIEDWGGKGALNARVLRKDPIGFTKVSALGIEEQRVNVVLDFTSPPAQWQKLGHSFKVTVRIITSHKKDALRVPLGALFRKADQWAVYTEQNGIAVLTPVTLGKFSLSFAEVLGGLKEGARVIVYPSDKVLADTPVTERAQGN